MSSTLDARLAFLPWVRQGAAASITALDTLGAAQPGGVQLTAAVAVNDTLAASLPVRLRGPGDVLGIDARQIVRTDPRPGTAGFEPNCFVAIEFDRPDFPWLFTPAKADASGRLRPWLVLIVVRRQAGVSLLPAGEQPLPVLDIAAPAQPADELPDLAESWCWVHTQLAGQGSAADALAAPELSLSRLLCPRLLEPDTDYLACLVPAFELGRKGGLGLAIKDEDSQRLEPAWTLKPTPPAQVRLPVYYHWDFRSGAGGDFESLVLLLKARLAPPELGHRPVVVGQPGFELPEGFDAQTTLDVGGALMPLDAPAGEPAWPADTQAGFQGALAPIVNAPGEQEAIAPTADPLLAPPLYGRWHRARATVRTDGAEVALDWLDELNLDPRHRAVASFGTQVVQEHQEALMASAWEQAGDLQGANQQLRQLQLGLFVGRSLVVRHFERFSVDALLRVGAPAFTRISLSAAQGARSGSTQTLAAQLAGTTLPLRAASPAMRRLSRPLGPINRRLVVQGIVRPTNFTLVSRLADGAAAIFTPPPPPSVLTFNVLRSRLANPDAVRPFGVVTGEAVQAVVGRPQFRVLPEGQPVPAQKPIKIRKPTDNAAARAFRDAAQRHLDKIDAGRMGIMIRPAPTQPLAELQAGVLAQMAPQRTLVALVQARFALAASPRAASAQPALPIEPVMHAPRFPQPMYEPLRDLSQDLLLPGLEAVPPNSVIGLQTNRRFVEAYLVGLNHEMGHELLWRGYPTDQRGTCFDRFWDTRGADTPRADIAALHTWGARRLGDADGAPQRERFVMLMRSELLRRYPTAVICATPARLAADGTRHPSPDPDDEIHPAFRGSMQPDVSFFGFDLSVPDAVGDPGYYIVIQEQPSEPRFGLDVAYPRPAATYLSLADGALVPLPRPGLVWGGNGAHTAVITRRMPVRIAIHASQFVAH